MKAAIVIALLAAAIGGSVWAYKAKAKADRAEAAYAARLADANLLYGVTQKHVDAVMAGAPCLSRDEALSRASIVLERRRVTLDELRQAAAAADAEQNAKGRPRGSLCD